MQDQIAQLIAQVEELQNKLADIERGRNITFSGNLDELLVERVIIADTSGTPGTNTLLRNITADTVLDYPERIMIFKWKGQRLAIPVYDADKIIYP